MFLKHPTLSIDLPLKALAWEDGSGKVWVSYNSAHYVLGTIYGRRGATAPADRLARLEGWLTAATDAAVQ